MQICYKSILALSLAMLLSTSCLADVNGAESPEKLKEMLQDVYTSKDQNMLKRLYLSRGDEQQINAVAFLISQDFSKSVKSIEWKESNNHGPGSYTGQGGVVHTYCPGPVGGGSITVNYSDDDGHKVIPAVFWYGQENGRYYLVTTCS